MEKRETGMSKRKKQFVKTAKCLSKREKVTKSPLFLSVLGVQAQGVWASRPHPRWGIIAAFPCSLNSNLICQIYIPCNIN